MTAIIFVLLVLWCVCAAFTARVASSRGRSPADWAVVGFLFGPIALLAVGFMPPVQAAASPQSVLDKIGLAVRRTLF